MITIPEYEKITYTTEPVVHGDIAPVLDLRLKSEQFERKEYYPDHDEMEVDQVFVHVGDVVQNGDTLVTFSSEDITEERRQYENRVLMTLIRKALHFVDDKYSKMKDTAILLTTGATERNCSKNIYDVAGNCWEWTTESVSSGYRVSRGRQLQQRWF